MTEDEDRPIWLNILINKRGARSLTLLIFAIGCSVCRRPQPGHESMMPLLSLPRDSCIKRGLSRHVVSVCLSVCHVRTFCQND